MERERIINQWGHEAHSPAAQKKLFGLRWRASPQKKQSRRSGSRYVEEDGERHRLIEVSQQSKSDARQHCRMNDHSGEAMELKEKIIVAGCNRGRRVRENRRNNQGERDLDILKGGRKDQQQYHNRVKDWPNTRNDR